MSINLYDLFLRHHTLTIKVKPKRNSLKKNLFCFLNKKMEQNKTLSQFGFSNVIIRLYTKAKQFLTSPTACTLVIHSMKLPLKYHCWGDFIFYLFIFETYIKYKIVHKVIQGGEKRRWWGRLHFKRILCVLRCDIYDIYRLNCLCASLHLRFAYKIRFLLSESLSISLWWADVFTV